ncbi:hypothetical protein Dimus_021027 [Dionaea muscipula]
MVGEQGRRAGGWRSSSVVSDGQDGLVVNHLDDGNQRVVSSVADDANKGGWREDRRCPPSPWWSAAMAEGGRKGEDEDDA